jgi:hypothetical protein
VSNNHWSLMVARFPGGLMVLGPDARRIVAAALEDALAYRRQRPACSECPNPGDLHLVAEMGVATPPKCDDHQIDDDAADLYAMILDQVDPDGHPGRLLREAVALADGQQDGDAPWTR